MWFRKRQRNVSYIWTDAAGLSFLGRTFSALEGLGAFGFRDLCYLVKFWSIWLYCHLKKSQIDHFLKELELGISA